MLPRPLFRPHDALAPLMPQTRSDALPYQLHQPLVGCVQPTLGHDVPGQVARGQRPIGLPQGVQHEPGYFALEGRVTRGHRLRPDILQVDVRLEQPYRGVEVIQVDVELAEAVWVCSICPASSARLRISTVTTCDSAMP